MDTLHLSYQAPFCDHRAPNYGKSSIYQNKPAKFTQLLFAENSKHFSVLNNSPFSKAIFCKLAITVSQIISNHVKVIKYVEVTLSKVHVYLWTRDWGGYE